jgi:hypothetical protein
MASANQLAKKARAAQAELEATYICLSSVIEFVRTLLMGIRTNAPECLPRLELSFIAIVKANLQDVATEEEVNLIAPLLVDCGDWRLAPEDAQKLTRLVGKEPVYEISVGCSVAIGYELGGLVGGSAQAEDEDNLQLQRLVRAEVNKQLRAQGYRFQAPIF